MFRNIMFMAVAFAAVAIGVVTIGGGIGAWAYGDVYHQRTMDKIRAIFGQEPARPHIDLDIESFIPGATEIVPDPIEYTQFLGALEAVDAAMGRDTSAYAGVGTSFLKETWGDFEAPTDPAVAASVERFGYFSRYEPAALGTGDMEALARLHVAGPNWRNDQASVAYWKSVQRHMDN